jgi:hypothetical protein
MLTYSPHEIWLMAQGPQKDEKEEKRRRFIAEKSEKALGSPAE